MFSNIKKQANFLLPKRKRSYESNLFLRNLLTYLLRGLSPQANYTDRATAVCRQS
jgi:hypothetical protein